MVLVIPFTSIQFSSSSQSDSLRFLRILWWLSFIFSIFSARRGLLNTLHIGFKSFSLEEPLVPFLLSATQSLLSGPIQILDNGEDC